VAITACFGQGAFEPDIAKSYIGAAEQVGGDKPSDFVAPVDRED